MGRTDVHSRIRRIALAVASLSTFSLFATQAVAGGAVLPSLDRAPPASVDVRMAVASTPIGSTRWSELTLPSGARALWLVPARPGAAVDWVPRRWLDALDEATTPRIVPPRSTADCVMRATPETAPSWATTATTARTSALTVASSTEAVLSYAADHGYRISPTFSNALSAFYEDGWRVLLLEVSADATMATSGTLRVSDDAGAIVPLALSSGIRMTSFAIGHGRASLPGANEVDVTAEDLRWGPLGSSYASWQNAVIADGQSWLRESYSHAALFEGEPIDGATTTRSVASSYFTSESCTATASAVNSSLNAVGSTCAPGSAARVPGGTPCTAAAASIDPSVVSCGEQVDFALALASAEPASTYVTRWVGTIPDDVFGANLPLSFRAAPAHGPVFRAGSYEPCLSPSGPNASSGARPAGSSGGTEVGTTDVVPLSDSEGCGSSASYVGEEEPVPVDSSSDSCSNHSPSTTSDGWDDSDSSNDGCSKSDSSDDTSDSCCSSSSPKTPPSSDDGWDTEDEARPKAVKPHAAHRPIRRKSSPASRLTLLGIAVILPLRRRHRPPS